MTKEEINNAIEKIREHCSKHNACYNCEAFTHHKCMFVTRYPNHWLTTIELDKEESEE